MSRVYIASDHAGYELKESIKSHFDFDFIDCGPTTPDRVDYPDYADRVCKKILEDEEALGLLICGSGQGMSMRANKYQNIRAALAWNNESAALSRQHNKANILCLGSRLISEDEAFETFQTFMKSEFEGGRHLQRVNKISQPVN